MPQYSWNATQFDNISVPIEFVFDQSRARLYSFHNGTGTINSAFASWDSQNNLEYIKGVSGYEFVENANVFDGSNLIYSMLHYVSDPSYFSVAVWNTTDGSLNRFFQDSNPSTLSTYDTTARLNSDNTAIYLSSYSIRYGVTSI